MRGHKSRSIRLSRRHVRFVYETANPTMQPVNPHTEFSLSHLGRVSEGRVGLEINETKSYFKKYRNMLNSTPFQCRNAFFSCVEIKENP